MIMLSLLHAFALPSKPFMQVFTNVSMFARVLYEQNGSSRCKLHHMAQQW